MRARESGHSQALNLPVLKPIGLLPLVVALVTSLAHAAEPPEGKDLKPGDEAKATKAKAGTETVVDLDIIVGSSDMSEDKEDSDGEILQPNIDDDDGDAGAGNSPTPDKDDPDGVAGEDDYIRLRLHKVLRQDAADLKIRLSFPTDRVAIWKSDSLTQAVASGSTEFPANADTTVYVTGQRPSTASSGEAVTMKLYDGQDVLGEDSVKITVAEPIVALFGDGATGESDLTSYLSSVTKDGRSDPYIVKAGDKCYAVFIWHSEKLAKIALGTQGASVVYDGHSNFGIGFAFSTGKTRLHEFMNVSMPLIGICWTYLRGHGHPQLDIPEAEYGDDTTSPESYDPWKYTSTISGTSTHDVVRYASSPVAQGDHLSLTRGTDRWEDYHFAAQPPATYKFIVVAGGAADMPAKRWSRVFLNSCLSGQYYYEAFNHGALFFTTADAGASDTTKAFVKAIIDGKNNSAILSSLNICQDINDYHQF